MGDPGSRLTQEFAELGSQKSGCSREETVHWQRFPHLHCIPRLEEPGTNLPLSCGFTAHELLYTSSVL